MTAGPVQHGEYLYFNLSCVMVEGAIMFPQPPCQFNMTLNNEGEIFLGFQERPLFGGNHSIGPFHAYFESPFDWVSGSKICGRGGNNSHLAWPSESAEIDNFLQFAPAWLGIRDSPVQDFWVFSDGSEFNIGKKENGWFAPDQPVDISGLDDCIYIGKDGELYSGSCSLQLPLICQLSTYSDVQVKVPISHGNNTIILKATDASGLTDEVGLIFNWVSHWFVDRSPPLISVLEPVNGLTNSTSFTLSVVCEKNLASQCFIHYSVNGRNLSTIPCVVNATTPQLWSGSDSGSEGVSVEAGSCPTSEASLRDGRHTITIWATDDFGIMSLPQTVVLDVDTTPPVLKLITAPVSPTGATVAQFFVEVSEKSGFDLQYSLDGSLASPICSTTAKAESVFSTGCPYKSGVLENGVHKIVFFATDSVGNRVATNYSWTVDARLPVGSILALQPSLTNRTYAAFSLRCMSNFRCHMNYTLDGNVVAYLCATEDAVGCNISFSDLAEGSHSLVLKTVDEIGLRGSDESYSWVVDVSLPRTSLDRRPPVINALPFANFTFTCEDAHPPCSYQYSLDGSSWHTTLTAAISLLALDHGPHTLIVHAIDGAGNQDMEGFAFTWEVDLVAPVAFIGSAPAAVHGSSVATFSFGCSEDGIIQPEGTCTFQYKLNSAFVWERFGVGVYLGFLPAERVIIVADSWTVPIDGSDAVVSPSKDIIFQLSVATSASVQFEYRINGSWHIMPRGKSFLSISTLHDGIFLLEVRVLSCVTFVFY